MRQTLLSSPLVGRSTLAGSFRQSRGFALTFTHAGLDVVRQRFSELKPFLEAALDSKRRPSFTPFWRRRPTVNAWYLNLLLLGEGASVGRHVDGTLRGPTAEPELTPVMVSVLYLAVPPGGGGELVLSRGVKALAIIEPTEGTMVHFAGHLDHEVRPVGVAASAEAGRRASLVLEQYALGPQSLGRLPPFKIDSRAGFESYLADRASRAVQPLDLE